MSEPILSIKGVTKAFNTVQALRGIDLEVPRGRIFGIVGPNGAGKTTLFSILCGFLGADKGEVLLDGKPVRPQTPPANGLLSILPQDARFLPQMPLGPQLAYYAQLGGMSKSEAKSEAQRVLGLVGLSEVFNRTGKTLSHGMYKRVGIAQAFMGNPKLIILDEPTAGLDPHAAREIHSQLRSMRADQTVIVSSHNLAEIEDLCHAVAIIKAMLVDAAEVSFRLPEKPSEALLASIQALPFVTLVQWDHAAARARIDIDTAQMAADEAGGALVQFFVGQSVRFMDMQVGADLEERFIRETR
jgi:ABC-2 type transport system ATP-binding protein